MGQDPKYADIFNSLLDLLKAGCFCFYEKKKIQVSEPLLPKAFAMGCGLMSPKGDHHRVMPETAWLSALEKETACSTLLGAEFMNRLSELPGQPVFDLKSRKRPSLHLDRFL